MAFKSNRHKVQAMARGVVLLCAIVLSLQFQNAFSQEDNSDLSIFSVL